MRQCSVTMHNLFLNVRNKSDGWLSCCCIFPVYHIVMLIRNFWIQLFYRTPDLSYSAFRCQPDKRPLESVYIFHGLTLELCQVSLTRFCTSGLNPFSV